MAAPRPDLGGTEAPVGHVRVTTRSILVLVGLLALGLGARNIAGRSTRVLGWVVVAIIVAGLLHPPVAALSRRVRRPLALVIVVVAVAAPVAAVGYAAFDDLRTETTRLQRALPIAARRLEASQQWGRAAREFRLAERVDDFVDELPVRAAGGTTAAALRSTATRGVAFVATGVLSLFLLTYGPRLVDGALGVIGAERRARTRAVVGEAYRRAWGYVVGRMAMGALAGAVAYAVCTWARLPGAAVLALLVGVMSLVPYVGVLIGSLPALLLAFGFRPGTATGVAVSVSFLAYQLFEALALQSRLDRRTIKIGPVLPVVVAMVAFDFHGLGGAICAVALMIYAVALADALAPTDPRPLSGAAVTEQ